MRKELNMPKHINRTSTYEFDLNEIKQLVANELKVNSDQVTVEYVLEDIGDDRFSNLKVAKLKVTVRES